jgi:hypothetical protein
MALYTKQLDNTLVLQTAASSPLRILDLPAKELREAFPSLETVLPISYIERSMTLGTCLQ